VASKKAVKEVERLSCATCPLGDDKKEARRVVLKTLKQVTTKLSEKMTGKDYTPTTTEFMKLMQLESDFAEDDIKEVVVKWVEPNGASTEK